MEHKGSLSVADRRYTCEHVKKLKQYKKSNIIIETIGKENQLQDKWWWIHATSKAD
jgi:hypothetical protein